MAKTIVFDFDGVIHSYSSGYQGAHTAADPIVPGMAEVIQQLRSDGYQVVVVSSRCITDLGKQAVVQYLDKYNIEVDDIRSDKPPAICYVDDRAVCFKGDTTNLVNDIKSFTSWVEVKS